MSEIEVFAKSIVKAASTKLSPITFLSAQVRKMEREDVDALAVAYLLAQVKQRKRSEVLTIERESKRPKRGTVAYRQWLENPANAKAAADERELLISYEEIDRETMSSLNSEINQIIDKFKSELRVEWTSELLASSFALGDGTTTTWGEATREQHTYRMQMHRAHAIAGAEGAARHMQAIETLDATGASNLYAAVKVAA